MLKYAVVEIAGRQYIVEPGKELIVNNLGDVKSLDCDKVLLLASEKALEIGKPYLKDGLKFDVLEQVRGKKIRVSRFHSKANTRKVTGSRSTMTKIKLAEAKKAEEKAVKKEEK